MKTFRRMQQMMRASVHEVLDRAENPRAMVNQMIRDMEAGLEEMRATTVTTLAAARTAERRLERTEAAVKTLQDAVTCALEQGDEDAARDALRRRKSLDHTVAVLKREGEEARTLSERMKRETKLVEARLREARVRRDTLVAHQAAAQTRRRLYDHSAQFTARLQATVDTARSLGDTDSDFARMQESIDRQVAEVEAREELLREQDVSAAELLVEDRELDRELDALRARLGSTARPVGPAA